MTLSEFTEAVFLLSLYPGNIRYIQYIITIFSFS